MSNAQALVTQVVKEHSQYGMPNRVREIVDRHHQSLLDLATTLLIAGRSEAEVVDIIEKASESFFIKLYAETKGL